MSDHEQERLSAYLDGELLPAEMAAVKAHVSACQDCAARLAELAAVDRAAAALPATAPSGYFETLPARVRARLEPRAPTRRFPVWTWAAAAALLLAVITPLTLWQRPASDASPSTGEVPAAAPATLASAPAQGEDPQAAPAAPKLATRAKHPAGAVATPLPLAANQASLDFSTKGELASAPPEADLRQSAKRAAPGEARRAGGLASPPTAPAREALAAPRDEAAVREGASEGELLGSRAREQATAMPDRRAADVAADSVAQATAAQATAEDHPLAREQAAGPMGGTISEPRAAGPEADWRRLLAARPRTPDEWRRLREEWRRFAEADTGGPHVDDARVRTIQAGYRAWRTGADPADEVLFRRDASAYLEREDAMQKQRVRELLR